MEVKIRLNPDGALAGRPAIVDQEEYRRAPAFRAVADSAVRALQNPRCSPLRLPYASYALWREVVFNFDLEELLR